METTSKIKRSSVADIFSAWHDSKNFPAKKKFHSSKLKRKTEEKKTFTFYLVRCNLDICLMFWFLPRSAADSNDVINNLDSVILAYVSLSMHSMGQLSIFTYYEKSAVLWQCVKINKEIGKSLCPSSNTSPSSFKHSTSCPLGRMLWF
jgi:hypothetical protein